MKVEKFQMIYDKQLELHLKADRRRTLEDLLNIAKDTKVVSEDISPELFETTHYYRFFNSEKDDIGHFWDCLFPKGYFYKRETFNKFRKVFEKRCCYSQVNLSKNGPDIYISSLKEYLRGLICLIDDKSYEKENKDNQKWNELLKVPYLESLFENEQLHCKFSNCINDDDIFDNIYEYAINAFLKEYYTSLLYKNDNFNADNCIGFLPDKSDFKSYEILFSYLFNLTFLFLQKEVLSVTPEAYLDKEGQISYLETEKHALNSVIDDLEYDIEYLESQYEHYRELSEEKDKIIGDKETEIEKLKEELEKSQKVIKRLSKENRLLEYNVEQAEKEYALILEKLGSGDKELEEIITEKELKDEDEKIDFTKVKENYNIDYNGKYLFVMEQSGIEENNILNIFPNATFVNMGKVHTLQSLRKIDLVVIMTKYIKHATYYKIKEFCKQNDVPYVHCGTRNINTIMQCISECYERKIIDKEA